jgi:hypothetical protein
MSIKKRVDDFLNANKKSRLKERTVYLLEQAINTSEHKIENLRKAYKRLERKKDDRYGKLEDDVFYIYYNEIIGKCIGLKDAVLNVYVDLESIKKDIDLTDELGKLHADRYKNFIEKTDNLNIILDQIHGTFGSWFIGYRMRLNIIRKRFHYLRSVLVQIQDIEVRPVPLELQNIRPDNSFMFRLTKNQNYPTFIPNLETNENLPLKRTMKSMKKTRSNNSTRNSIRNSTRNSMNRSPIANPVIVAEKTKYNFPMAVYYKNSPLQGKVVPLVKNKETLLKVLDLFSEFSNELRSMDKLLKETKHAYSKTYKTYLKNPHGYMREKSIQALLNSMDSFEKLIAEKQKEVEKKIEIEEKTFNKIVGELGTSYAELKEKLLFKVTNENVGRNSLNEVRTFVSEKSQDLYIALKTIMEKDYVNKHFSSPNVGTRKNRESKGKALETV